MTEVILSIVVLGAVMAMMAVGVLMGKSPIKGSCGGMSAIGMKGACDICGADANRCDNSSADEQKKAGEGLAYDAAKQQAETRH